MGFALNAVEATCVSLPEAVLASAPAMPARLIGQVLDALVLPGSSVVLAEHHAAMLTPLLRAAAARGIVVPARAFAHDLAAMADALAPDTRLVLLSNPDLLTGAFLPGSLLEAFVARMPAQVAVLLDESAGGLLPAELRYDSLAWLAQHPRLLLCRRAGAQSVLVGAAALMRRVDGTAHATSVGAGVDEAAAALNAAGLAQIRAGLHALNLACLPSVADFLVCRVGDGAAVGASLQAQGLAVRSLVAEGMPQWLRVVPGLPAENDRFLAALAAALKG